jgi:2-polyprenyl-3-methyl-5-hydroxy-6-metoxy-1,4-benzoquinol methylase
VPFYQPHRIPHESTRFYSLRRPESSNHPGDSIVERASHCKGKASFPLTWKPELGMITAQGAGRRRVGRRRRKNEMLTPKRIYEEELLDAGEGTDEDVAQSLTDLRRINRFLGGRKVVLRAISSCLDGDRSRRVSLLDVGTGSADIPMAVAALCSQRGLETLIAAVDISERNLRVSRARLQVTSEVHLVQADSLKLPFASRSFDFVTASLFLHHFREEDVVRLLADFGRIASRAVIVNDLVRNLVPYYFTRITFPILAASFLTRNDGPVSVLRGFTPAEMNELAQRAGLTNREVKRVFPYRLSLIADVRS